MIKNIFKIIFILIFFSHLSYSLDKPNFILILTDDQAWSGTSIKMDSRDSDSYGDGYITPSIKRLANEGIRFSNGYAAGPVCVPSRYSIQLGQSVARHGMTSVFKLKNSFDYRSPDTLAELLKKYDPSYVTAHFGKWHIETEPHIFGFDVSDGKTGNKEGGDDGKTAYKVRINKDPKLTSTLKDRAVNFLKEQAESNNPFFMQISHYANHTWITADPDDLIKYENIPKEKQHRLPAYSAMTEALDRSIGGVLTALDELGLSENTYVFFTADNGAVPSIPPKPNPKKNLNKPLQGGKWSLKEGGIRVPFIVRGPNITPITQCDAPISGIDILPTIMDLSNNKSFSTSQKIDGISFASLLFHGNNSEDINYFNQRNLTWHFPRFNKWNMARAESAIRKNGWKLIYSWEDNTRELYKIDEDHKEEFELSLKEVKIADNLQNELFNYLISAGQVVPPDSTDQSNK